MEAKRNSLRIPTNSTTPRSRSCRGYTGENTVKLRDSAEKAWNASVQAANALALKYTGLIPKSHHERRSALREVEQKVPELAKLGIYDRYAARSRLLQRGVLYEGVLGPNLLKIEGEKLFELIEITKAHIKPGGS